MVLLSYYRMIISKHTIRRHIYVKSRYEVLPQIAIIENPMRLESGTVTYPTSSI